MGKSLEPNGIIAVAGWWWGQHLMGPTAAAKQRHLLRLLKSRNHRVVIESGTYKGATTARLARRAEHVFTVELDDTLAAGAVKKFAGTNVTVVHGDSLEEIPKLIAAASSPPLVFLDGHYSGPGTAEGVEMEPSQSILGKLRGVTPTGSTIVIDDLRLFGSGLAGFPQLDEITKAARSAFPDAVIRIGLDSIVVEL